MPPLTLPGENLGRKHFHLNKLVSEAIENGTKVGPLTESNDNDIENLFKIEVASRNKNVEYILGVLKSEDMLYVSRAIRKSPWLITDRLHSHIINPEYLHTVLIPLMTPKASCKLLLQVRLLLKDEDRIDEFYKYYEDKDKNLALKWLPKCSKEVIESFLEKHDDVLDIDTFRKISEKTFKVMDMITTPNTRYYPLRNYLNILKRYLESDTEKYLDALEKIIVNYWMDATHFNKKQSKIVLQKFEGRILEKFDKYAPIIDLETLGKHLGTEKLKEFLIKQSNNKDLSYWFKYENIKPLIKQLPRAEQFEFMKKLFMDKKAVDEDIMPLCGLKMYADTCRASSAPSSANIYLCYRHATFEQAFPDLIQLLKAESSPGERVEILKVLLITAGYNMQNLETLLQYYVDKHINESYRYKNDFISAVIFKLMNNINIHKFNGTCWNILDKLFHSMEVYIESNNNVQNCVKAVILNKLLSDQPIPKTIEDKFMFSTFKDIKNKLSVEDQFKVFNYLYNLQEDKLKKDVITDKEGFENVFSTLLFIMLLLKDWEKDFTKYPILLEKIKQLIDVKQKREWKIDVEELYNKNKSWRRHMFEESLLLSRKEQVLLNILKHDVSLFERQAAAVESMRRDDNIVIDRVLSKLKIYWSNNVAIEWGKWYKNCLDTNTGLHAVTRGLSALLPRDNLIELVKKYEPNDPMINWGDIDEVLLSVRKNFAKVMHVGRPQLPPSSILPFARGDYLQFALPSLVAIFYNLPASKCKESLPQIMDGPVSVQKHGIRLAFSKFKSEELKDIFSKTWNTCKNLSIRAVVFGLTMNLLCKERNETRIEEIWELLQIFIDNLSFEENKNIYVQLSNVDNVPKVVKGKFCMRSYKFLKSLPPKANCDFLVEKVVNSMSSLVEDIDSDFITEVLVEYMQKDIPYNLKNNVYRLASSFVLYAKENEEQLKRYENVIKLIVDNSLNKWNYRKEEDGLKYQSREDLEWIHRELMNALRSSLSLRKFAIPANVFKEIATELEKKLPIVESYSVLTMWKLTSAFVDSCKEKEVELKDIVIEKEAAFAIGSMTDDYKYLKQMWPVVVPGFATHCSQLLKEDIDKHYPSIRQIFSNSFNSFVISLNYDQDGAALFTKTLLTLFQDVPTCLMANDTCPHYVYDEKLRKEIHDIFLSHPSQEVKMHFCYSHIGQF